MEEALGYSDRHMGKIVRPMTAGLSHGKIYKNFVIFNFTLGERTLISSLRNLNFPSSDINVGPQRLDKNSNS